MKVPWRSFLGIVLLLAAVAATAYWAGRLGASSVQETGNPVSAAARQSAGVVTIYTYDDEGEEIGQGSGFLVSADGLAITNLHVLDDASRVEVQLANGRQLDLLYIHAYDTDQDMALLQLGMPADKTGKRPPLQGLRPLQIGASTRIQVGDRIATVTAPQGLANTVTDGLVSSIREENNRRVLQITAPISHGSSGGPVFDVNGDVVGIATSQLDEGQNLNFAVPAEAVVPLLARRDKLTLAKLRDTLQPAIPPAGQESCFRLGQKLFEESRYREALEEFFHAQDDRPAWATPYREAGRCYERMGALDLAAKQYYRFLAFARNEDPDREAVIEWLRLHNKRLPPL